MAGAGVTAPPLWRQGVPTWGGQTDSRRPTPSAHRLAVLLWVWGALPSHANRHQMAVLACIGVKL